MGRASLVRTPSAEHVWFALLDYAFLTNLMAGHYRTGADHYSQGIPDRIRQGVHYLEDVSRDEHRKSRNQNGKPSGP